MTKNYANINLYFHISFIVRGHILEIDYWDHYLYNPGYYQCRRMHHIRRKMQLENIDHIQNKTRKFDRIKIFIYELYDY